MRARITSAECARNRKKVRARLLLPFFIYPTLFTLALLSPLHVVWGSENLLQIDAATGKSRYDLGEDVHIFGNLVLNMSLVDDGLVAMQVNNPSNTPVAIRTLHTGVPVTSVFEILEVIPCDGMGNQKDSFVRGTLAYFKVKVRNGGTVSRDVLLVFNVYDVNMVTLGVVIFPGPISIPPGTEEKGPISFPIRYTTALGEATVYVSAYNRLPRDFGVPYCLEKSVTFAVTNGQTSSVPASGNQTVHSTDEGTFTATLKLPSYPPDGEELGTYEAYLTSTYMGERDISYVTFDVVLTCDLNSDGTVDIFDVVIVAKGFGSSPGHPEWNQMADLTGDEVVDIYDVVTLALDYGKTAG